MLQCSNLSDPGGGLEIDCSSNKTCKRLRPNSPELLHNLDTPLSTQLKRKISFLIVKRNDGKDMSKVSPFLLDKLLSSVAGPVKKAKKLKDGTLLVETTSYEQADKLLDKLPQNISLPVSVEPHKTLNVVKGVINCFDLDTVDVDEIKVHLASQGVADVTRMKRRVNGELKWSHNYILHFYQSLLPSDIKIGYLNVQVRPYIPLPIRCFNCFKFNHTKNQCLSKTKCPECSLDAHENDLPCEREKRCINCDGNHSAMYKECPKWEMEKEISKIKTIEKIPYHEAQKKINSTKLTKSYSSVISGQTNKTEISDRETQCNLALLPPLEKLKPKSSLRSKPILTNKKLEPKKSSENLNKAHHTSKLDPEIKKKSVPFKNPPQELNTTSEKVQINQNNKISEELIIDWNSEPERDESMELFDLQETRRKTRNKSK